MNRHKRTLMVLLTMMLTLVLASTGICYAGGSDKSTPEEKPIREAHKVVIENKQYCFLVTHNVVLTKAEIADLTDEELTAEILKRAGFYIKESSCRNSSHKAITPEEWSKDKGPFLFDPSDLEAIREAEPLEGEPEQFSMNVIVCTKPINEDDPEDTSGQYSTYKRNEPKLIFAVVATEEDAKLGEDICEEENLEPEPEKKDEPKKDEPKKEKEKKKEQPKQKTKPKRKTPSVPEPKEPAETLPEYKTIPMVDRSGKPVEDSLQEGEPVTLEWEEPGRKADSGKLGLIDRIPGRYAGLAAMAAALAAVAGAVIVLRKRRQEEEYDE